MLDNKRYLELKLMFDLFRIRAASLKSFQQKIMEYIITRGEKMVEESQSEDLRIPSLIKFRE